MRRYFFHVTDGHGVIMDREGTELDGEISIQSEATSAIPNMLSDSDRKGYCRRHWRMNVVRDDGEVVFSLLFAHALQSDLISVR